MIQLIFLGIFEGKPNCPVAQGIARIDRADGQGGVLTSPWYFHIVQVAEDN